MLHINPCPIAVVTCIGIHPLACIGVQTDTPSAACCQWLAAQAAAHKGSSAGGGEIGGARVGSSGGGWSEALGGGRGGVRRGAAAHGSPEPYSALRREGGGVPPGPSVPPWVHAGN